MNYFSYQDKEMSQAGIQEGELAVYTGTVNPRQADGLFPDPGKSNAYVYLWQDGQKLELGKQFSQDGVLDVQVGEETYTFLRDGPSGYIRQTAGPAAPIVVANIGAIPLRVDTFLGKFTVHAGIMLRLDGNAPRREKKKVLLTIGSQCGGPLEGAELWDGGAWRRLNIREDPVADDRERRLAVLDGSAIVQYMSVNGKGEILMMDAPEPDPDYEIYLTSQAGEWVRLRFNRTDYQDGQVVPRARSIFFGKVGEPVAYDLQKLRESRTEAEAYHCLAGLPAGWEAELAPAGPSRPPLSDKLRAFLGNGDGPDAPPLESGGTNAEHRREDCEETDGLLEEVFQPVLKAHGAPTPEPPGDFPE